MEQTIRAYRIKRVAGGKVEVRGVYRAPLGPRVVGPPIGVSEGDLEAALKTLKEYRTLSATRRGFRGEPSV